MNATLTLVDEQLEQLIADTLRDAGVIVRVAFRRDPGCEWEWGTATERGAFTHADGRRLMEVCDEHGETLMVPVARGRCRIEAIEFPSTLAVREGPATSGADRV